MRNERVRIIVEIGLTVALFAALQYLGIRLPINIAGGSISVAMLPIVVLALRRGPLVGVAAGALCGVVDGLLLEQFFFHPVQVVLDYPVAFGAVGLAGLGAGQVRRATESRSTLGVGLTTVPWTILGCAARLGAHWVSGVIFFASSAPAGQAAWVYSLLYNASYIVPSTVAVAVLAALIVPVLERAVPPATAAGSVS